ncbi:MAG: hypothetical protein A2091_04510 [Desulfuromonadales bacterium GWD2_61_12]|nr:MAG: hypothetical protein A2005_07575 [Desulfuromonadales bacterium GWC2_61_20]OGR34468.1 MAG: hypothetical protein A2091_04510 [Desulfuromonadales bacterium GWD2_61_12]HAD03852.1 hypothetical protein [Desulfuromonas sp.]HBT82208.1 hypothetical protein [Desulfuromonas sp.]
MVIDLFRHRYRLLIFLLLTAFLFFSFWAARQAFLHRSKVTDVDYYSKGLNYSITRDEEEAAASLGWNLRIELHQRHLALQLSDRSNLPVDNAAGTLIRLSPTAVGAQPVILQEGPSGTYQLSLPSAWHGETVLHLEFFRNGARFSRRLLLDLQP